MPAFQELKHLLSLLYIVPSLILYFIILYLIFFSSSKQKFSASFYWIFGFSAINYVLHAVIYYFLIRFTAIPTFFPLLQALPEQHFSYPILYALLYYSGHGVHLYSLLISFNRFTIFILKTKYDIFWKKYLKYALCVCIFGPVFFVWNFPFIGIKNVRLDGYGAYITSTIEFPSWWRKSRNLVFEIALTASLSLIMNIYSVFAIVKWRYYDKQKISKFTSQDFAMFVYSFLVFVVEAASGVVQGLFLIDNFTFFTVILNNLYIIADLTALTPVWFVLITDKPLRNEIFKLLTCKSKNNFISVTSLTPRIL